MSIFEPDPVEYSFRIVEHLVRKGSTVVEIWRDKQLVGTLNARHIRGRDFFVLNSKYLKSVRMDYSDPSMPPAAIASLGPDIGHTPSNFEIVDGGKP